MSAAEFQVVDVLDDATLEAVKSELRAYNRAQNPGFFAKRDAPGHAPRPLHVVVRGADGRVAGGLLADTEFSWLRIDILAVRQDLRRTGIGTRLVRAAEEEAVRRGCRHAYVETMDYQAPGFYERLGYALAGRFPDWDSHGHAQHHYLRELGSHAPP